MGHKNGKQKVEEQKQTVDPFAGLMPRTSPNAIVPLTNADGNRINEMLTLNNTFSTLMKQAGQYDAEIFLLKTRREQINKGDIQMPVIIQLTRNISHAEGDKTKVLNNIDDAIKNMEMAKQGVTGTMERRRDEYAECVLRVIKLLQDKVKGFEIKTVQGVRPSDVETEAAEKIALEKELNAVLAKEKV